MPNPYHTGLPGNSISQRAEQPHSPSPVISGATQISQKHGTQILVDSGKMIWESLLKTTIIPNIKRLIDEAFTSAVRGALYGTSHTTQNNHNVLPFSPRSFYPARSFSSTNVYHKPSYLNSFHPQNSAQTPPEGVDADLGEILVQSPEDADTLLETAQRWIREYSEISVCKLAELAGLQAPYTGNEWGYYTMRGSEKVRRGNQWSIRLPAPTYLKR